MLCDLVLGRCADGENSPAGRGSETDLTKQRTLADADIPTISFRGVRLVRGVFEGDSNNGGNDMNDGDSIDPERSRPVFEGVKSSLGPAP